MNHYKPVPLDRRCRGTFDQLTIAYIFVAKKCCIWNCGCRSACACVNPVKITRPGKTNLQAKPIAR